MSLRTDGFCRTQRRPAASFGPKRLRYAADVTGAGYAAVSAAAVLWAVGGAVASRLIDRGADFVQLTEARAWITVLVLLLVAARSRASDGEGSASPALTVLFGLSIAGANFLYYASLSRLPVAVAITTQYTAPGLVVLWTSFAQRKLPSGRILAALAAAMVGVALLAELPTLVTRGELRVDAPRPARGGRVGILVRHVHGHGRAHGTCARCAAGRPAGIPRRERVVDRGAGDPWTSGHAPRSPIHPRCGVPRDRDDGRAVPAVRLGVDAFA